MLKRLLLLFICIVACTVCISEANNTNKAKVYKEVTNLCKSFGKSCTISERYDDSLGAFTGPQGKIIVTTGLLDAMNENQLRAVMYHEVGHVVFQHPEKLSIYLHYCNHNGTCNKDYIEATRRKDELQADRFAVYVMLFTGKPESLRSALRVLTPPEDYYTTQPTHPSTADRIKQIDRIMGR